MKKVFFVIILVLYGCGKSGSSDSVAVPTQVTLTAPLSNSTCTTGTVISATQSMVLFTWTTAANTESYELTIKNLLSGTTTTQATPGSQLQVTLLRNTPYSWYVISKTSKTTQTAQSSAFKFYNSGIATTYYAPFPADLTSPTLGQNISATTGKIALTWNGADVDNDIVGYDVYIGTNLGNIAIIKANLVATAWDVAITSGTTYYWKVVTKDSQGNASTSNIYQFSEN
jgi:hypothetical protein